MDLKQRIILERIRYLDQLSAAERQQVQADEILMQLIEENRGLGNVQAMSRESPPMQSMLDQTYSAADNHKENLMLSLARIVSGKPWYLKAALVGVFTLTVLAALILLPNINGSDNPTPAYAATDGYMLVYDFGNIGPVGEDGCKEEIGGILKPLEAAVREFGKARREADPDAEPVKVEIMVRVDDGDLVVTLALSDNTGDLLEELKAAVAKVPGTPVPTITNATWFSGDKGGCNFNDGLEVRLHDHLFTFPPTATEEEIESEIANWFAQNKPEAKVKVDVEISDADGEKKVEIKIIADK